MNKNAAITLGAVLVLGIAGILFLMVRNGSLSSQTTTGTSSSSVASSVSSTETQANILVSEPKPNEEIGNPVVIRGKARVFENTFAYRIKDASGAILVEDHAMADAPDIGQFGLFEVEVSYPTATEKGLTGTIEVFEYSAKDGSEINKVSIPIRFRVD